MKSYRQGLAQRFGLYCSGEVVDVWIHAVSVGEVVAATSVIEACLANGYRVLVTTMTPTGLEQVNRIWRGRVACQFIPYDFSFAIRRFLKDRQPKVFVIFETELWPGVIASCYKQQIPVLLLNARLSDRSFPRYLKTGFFWKRLFQYFSGIFCQSELDKQKFLKLGVQESKLQVSGNLKFNQLIQADKVKTWQDFKTHYPNKRVVVFGSTHPGEEDLCLKMIHSLRQQYQDLLFVVVPRHPERFDKVYRLLQTSLVGWSVVRYSTWQPKISEIDCLLVDVMGELSSLYAIADCAMVGGSLVPIGGHNILEPLAYDVPVLTGPFMHNQKDLLRIFQMHQALIYCHSWQEMLDGIRRLLNDGDYKQDIIQHGRTMLTQYKQALRICMDGVELALLKKRR